MEKELSTLKNSGKMLNEQKFQRTRKKIKIIAILVALISALMLIAGIVCAIANLTGVAIGLIFGGSVLLFVSIFLWILLHQREIGAFFTQQAAPVLEETVDKVDGPIMQKAAPHVGSMIKEVSKGWNEGKQGQSSKDDIELKLDQLEKLKKTGKINEDEYSQMRKKILGL